MCLCGGACLPVQRKIILKPFTHTDVAKAVRIRDLTNPPKSHPISWNTHTSLPDSSPVRNKGIHPLTVSGEKFIFPSLSWFELRAAEAAVRGCFHFSVFKSTGIRATPRYNPDRVCVCAVCEQTGCCLFVCHLAPVAGQLRGAWLRHRREESVAFHCCFCCEVATVFNQLWPGWIRSS